MGNTCTSIQGCQTEAHAFQFLTVIKILSGRKAYVNFYTKNCRAIKMYDVHRQCSEHVQTSGGVFTWKTFIAPDIARDGNSFWHL
jgi:hypothetical protein